MTQPIVKKLSIPHDSYDAVLQMMHVEPEGPETSPEMLKWNSAVRDMRAKFVYKFARD